MVAWFCRYLQTFSQLHLRRDNLASIQIINTDSQPSKFLNPKSSISVFNSSNSESYRCGNHAETITRIVTLFATNTANIAPHLLPLDAPMKKATTEPINVPNSALTKQFVTEQENASPSTIKRPTKPPIIVPKSILAIVYAIGSFRFLTDFAMIILGRKSSKIQALTLGLGLGLAMGFGILTSILELWVR